MDYWFECVSEAFDEAGIWATGEQIKSVADAVERAHENYGMAFGHDHIPNPLVSENKRLTAELERERQKIVCKECKGTGQLVFSGPCHQAITDCHVCRGSGKV